MQTKSMVSSVDLLRGVACPWTVAAQGGLPSPCYSTAPLVEKLFRNFQNNSKINIVMLNTQRKLKVTVLFHLLMSSATDLEMFDLVILFIENLAPQINIFMTFSIIILHKNYM